MCRRFPRFIRPWTLGVKPKILENFNLTDKVRGFQLNLLAYLNPRSFTWVAWVIKWLLMVMIEWSGNECEENVMEYSILEEFNGS